MKKFSIFAIIFALMLFSAQSVFAKNYVGINVSYGNLNMSGELIDMLKTNLAEFDNINLETSTNALVVNLKGGYDVTPKFSLVGGASTYISFKDTTFVVPNVELEEVGVLNYFNFVKSIFDVNIYARYQVYGFNKGSIGLQAGATFNNANLRYTQNVDGMINTYLDGFSVNGLFLNVGAYADIDINDKLNFYADAKFAVATKYSVHIPKDITDIADFSLHTSPTLVNSFFTNITAGLDYKVSPHVAVGVEWNATNMNIMGAAHSVLTWLNDSEIITVNPEPPRQEIMNKEKTVQVQQTLDGETEGSDTGNEVTFPQDAKLWTNTIGISVKYIF